VDLLHEDISLRVDDVDGGIGPIGEIVELLSASTNAAVNVVDAKRNVFVKQIHGGFKGFTGVNDTSGPNGVWWPGNFLFVTDAPAEWLYRPENDQIVGEAHTGGAPGLRTDELAYDPENSSSCGE